MAETALHYRITTDEWLSMTQDLKYAEVRVLIYLRTLDPYGDRELRVRTIDIASATGLSQGTVSKSLQVLRDKGYIGLVITESLITLTSKNKYSHRNTEFPQEYTIPTELSEFPQEFQNSHRNTTIPTGISTGLKPSPGNDSGPFKTDQTDQTDQTYLNSLSNVPPPTLEREFDEEELIEWVSKQNNQARNPRAYAIKCLKSNKKYWQDKYQEYLNRTNIPPQIIQENENLSDVERPSEEESVLGRLQCLWALPRKRQECIRRVEEHPEWGIKIDPDRGPVRVEEPVQAEAEAEDTAERFSPLGKVLESMKLQQVEEPVDLGDLITMIGFHLKRLGMSKVEAIARMIHHGWPATHPAILTRNLSVCSADDLLDLQEVLEGL